MFVYCSLMEMTVTVGLERALETQRVRLLRLLSGWFAVVAVLSGGRLAVPLPLWVRVFFDDLLIRAELAAQYMVQVSARMQARGDFAMAEGVFVQPARVALAPDEVPSTDALMGRMRALRRVLRELPRYGRRLLRRLRGRAIDRIALSDDRARDVSRPALPQWNAPQVERPPDKGLRVFC